jgi:hypothetical protein
LKLESAKYKGVLTAWLQFLVTENKSCGSNTTTPLHLVTARTSVYIIPSLFVLLWLAIISSKSTLFT